MSERELPPLNALRAFESVARLRSVTAAATELHVTHGAVSRQLRRLDEALGRPLFVRQGRGLVLSEAGNQLHEAANAAFGQLRESWAGLRQREAQAPFVLGCSSSLLARWVIPRLERLARDLPGVPLHLSAQESTSATDFDKLDAMLLLAAPPWPPRWQVQVLAPEQIGPVLSPGYPGWSRLRGQSADCLLDDPLLHTTSRPQAWPEWLHALGLAEPRSAPGASFPHLYHLLEAAIAGLGVAIAPAPLVADDLASGRLIAPWGFQSTAAKWILATSGRSPDRRASLLVDWLRQELARG
ncbi:MAG: LysR family transcriptional regulator [Rhodanobacter sp.]